jgi:putative nucleotidyltransferase with HDIG domain
MMTVSNHTILSHSLLQDVRELATQAGGQAYLVGGAVRDFLLTGSLPGDLDFMLLDCKAVKLSKKLADSRQGHLVPLDWQHGIHRVVFDDGVCVDLADAQDNNLQADLARRDLTINAMAMHLETGELRDPFQGQQDLENRRIRMVSPQNLLDDPLRMLRVFRFAALLSPAANPHLLENRGSTTSNLHSDQASARTSATQIDLETLEVVKTHGSKIWESAAERMQYEFLKMLSAPACFDSLQAMADCGLLEVLIPDLSPMRTIGGSGFHHLGLFEHTMELVRQAERLYPDLPEQARTWLQQPMGNAATRYGLVKLACLLHDIGKPQTMGEREDPIHGKRLTFYGHEELGEQMADPLLRRLKVSNDVREYIKKLVRWHLYPCQFGPDSPRKSVLRFYRRMGDDTPDIILLALADRFSATGPWITQADLEEARLAHLWLLDNYYAEQTILKVPRLLNGNMVMALLDIGPGPHLKEILDSLQEAQQLGEVHTVDDAKQWLLEKYSP